MVSFDRVVVWWRYWAWDGTKRFYWALSVVICEVLRLRRWEHSEVIWIRIHTLLMDIDRHIILILYAAHLRLRELVTQISTSRWVQVRVWVYVSSVNACIIPISLIYIDIIIALNLYSKLMICGFQMVVVAVYGNHLRWLILVISIGLHVHLLKCLVHHSLLLLI